ncbi:hypothetical protein FRC12_011333 [Ceratobasidium sp. 428]|nr:hypothetical protein FRC12_011333 [Ceratobasidium sp. 428]
MRRRGRACGDLKDPQTDQKIVKSGKELGRKRKELSLGERSESTDMTETDTQPSSDMRRVLNAKGGGYGRESASRRGRCDQACAGACS